MRAGKDRGEDRFPLERLELGRETFRVRIGEAELSQNACRGAGGREHRFNSLAQLFTNHSRWELGRWRFEAKGKDARLIGEISCRPDQMVGVTYTDPDGERLWCNNSKIARIRLTLTKPDGSPLAELSSDHGCAAEFVDRRIYSEVPIRI